MISRGFLGGTAALAAGTAVIVVALAILRSAAAALDPILAAIEAHRNAFSVAKAAVDQHAAFGRELSDHGRFQDRTEDDDRREAEIDAAVRASSARTCRSAIKLGHGAV